MAKSNLEKRTYSSNPAPSPGEILPPDEHLKPSASRDPIGFCQECAHHCMRKCLKPYDCRRFICRCSKNKYQ